MATIPKKPWAGFSRSEPKKPQSATPAQPVRRSADTINPYLPGDPIPKPEAVEKDTDTTWAEFADLQAVQNRGFADTAPASRTMRDADERSYAPTTPAPLQNLHARPATPVRKELTVVEVMVEARKNNRVCPKPAKWQELFEMLPDRRHAEPAPPLVGAAWNDTPSIPKRMCFREHIEWAAAHGALQQIYTFMKNLPESDWHHMGD
ncbi:hypothetical protein ACFPOE_11190 [Caenimonas terrae]|uniref:Uncharacterized protein n=1 Tax=Caenimonas terrae TaxID=696074 RepID=A0ABW0NDS8_9BURK